MSITEEIKSRLDIVDIVSETVQLRRSGRSYSGFCPFHSNSRTPAFYIFPETQTWHCFGACAEGGDIFSYVMKRDALDFKEALTILAAKAGVELETQTPKQNSSKEKQQIDLLSAAADYFEMLLMHAPEAERARQYVQNRGLAAETLQAFQLGFALDSWDACRSHFNAQGFDDQMLLEVGLLTENPDSGRRYDRFRNRLMFPIRDVNGRVVGFGARTLEKEGIPKYLNSPQTSFFDKSNLLYGLDTAKRDIREARQVVIVEGYMDVIQAWQAGFRNVVAQMGTALTETQLRLLKRYTKRFVLALDADAAGIRATMRGLQVARETLDRDVEVKFDAQGLVRYEGRLQADIRIVEMPEGQDPDDLIRQDPAEWSRLVGNSQPVVAFMIDVATRDLDLNDAKAKTAVARRVIPLIKDIQEPLERDHYWQELAQALKTDERSLRQVRLDQPARRTVQSNPPVMPESNAGTSKRPLKRGGRTLGIYSTLKREEYYLAQCLHYPQMIGEVNRKLAGTEQTAVAADEFSLAEDQALVRQMYQLISQHQVVTPSELWDSLDDIFQERVQRLQTLPHIPESELDKLADKLALSVLDWRQRKLNERLTHLRQLFPDTNTQQQNQTAMLYEQQTREASLAIQQINIAKSRMSATHKRRAEEAANGR